MKTKCDNCGQRFNRGDINRYTCPYCSMLTVEDYYSNVEQYLHRSNQNKTKASSSTFDTISSLLRFRR